MPKMNGTRRMCVDYRDINGQTEKDAFPVPRVVGVWLVLLKAKFLLHWILSWDTIK